MSETEPKYYTKSEANRMLEEVERQKWELFSEYEQMQQEIDDLKVNENLRAQNKELKNLLDYVIKNS